MMVLMQMVVLMMRSFEGSLWLVWGSLIRVLRLCTTAAAVVVMLVLLLLMMRRVVVLMLVLGHRRRSYHRHHGIRIHWGCRHHC